MNLSTYASRAMGLAASAIGGLLFTVLGVPLGWILGAMFGSAVYANIFGIDGKTRNIRRSGQLLIGVATAGVLTPDILNTIIGLLPAMIAAALAANVIGLAFAWPLGKMAGIDRMTALLSSLPAGMAEMSSLAKEVGARADIVTIVHTLRVIIVVLMVPALIATTTINPVTSETSSGTYAALLLCLIGGLVLAIGATRLNLLNPFIIMPMVLGPIFVAAGFPIARMPDSLLIAAQIFIGFSLGARLRREGFLKLPRAALAGLICGTALVAMMVFVIAPLIALWTGSDLTSVMLGTAPGGLGEMIASAKVVGASAAIVAGFQFVRSFLTNMIVPPLIIRVGKPNNGGHA